MSALVPYFTNGQISLYVGDMREVLPALVTEGLQADCVIADVPYGETSLAWDRWPDGWLDVTATAARSLWCFGSLRMFMRHGDEFTEAGWKLSQDLVIRKPQPTSFTRDRFRRTHELCTHWYRGRWDGIRHEVPLVAREGPSQSRRSKGGKSAGVHGAAGNRPYADDGTRLALSVLDAAPARVLPGAGGRAAHRTRKPANVLRDLIEYACSPGGLVVAPFAGSGSDLEAARNLGCRAIGIEIDGEACEKAARRLSQATLFGDGAA